MTTLTRDNRITNDTTLERLADAPVPRGPEWLHQRRLEALEQFRALGVPTTKHEEWRFTNIAPITKLRFHRADDAPAVDTAAIADQIAARAFELDAAATLVFVNGVFAPDLSQLDSAPDGLTVAPLLDAIETHRALVEPHLAQHVDTEREAFAAMNVAFMDAGALVHVARNAAIDKPIVVLNVAAATDEPLLAQPHNLVIAEEGANVSVIEDYVALSDDAVYLNNAVTEVVCGANSHVHHYFIERESRAAFNISNLRIEQATSSDFVSHSVLLGGSIARNNCNPALNGENCESTLNGLFLADAGQMADNHMRVEHNSPHCNSRQYYHGILGHEGRGVFTGRIIVVDEAQKTDAIQSNNNLLLDPTGVVNTKPQLEIYADDVRCTHGATIGQLDEEAIFYLLSRGFSPAEAKSTLVSAFIGENLNRMACEPLRDQLSAIVLDRLAVMLRGAGTA